MTTDLVSELRFMAAAGYAGCSVARKAADEIERLERERSEWAGIAAVRNRNIALIADERDQWREKCYLIYELITGQHRTTMQHPDVPSTTTEKST